LSQWAERAKFWRTIPPLSTAVFLAAVFCVFGTIGFLSVAFNPDLESPLQTALAVLISGAFAVGYAIAGTRHKPKALFFLVPCHIAAVSLLPKLSQRAAPRFNIPPALEHKILLDNIGAMVLVIGGYVLFLIFFQREGTRYFKVHTEMRLASEIHRALVPSFVLQIGEYELHGVSQPSGEVGGDLVDVIQEGDRWFGYVADVSGHGVPAGVMMAMVKSAIRMHWTPGRNASSLMEPLNSALTAVRPQGMFVTCAYLQSDSGTNLRFSLAGHLPILHFKAATGAVDEHSLSNFPLGLFPHKAFETSEIQCSPVDVLVVLTDGLSEVFDRNGRELGLEPLKRALQESGNEPLEQISLSLQRTARQHGPQSDDQTILIVRRLPVNRETAI
jgi:phosphoserine phosphatase RsbU/P